VPVGGRGNVQEDRERRPRFVPWVEEGYVRDVSSESDLPVVQVVEGSLIFQLEGETMGYLLKQKQIHHQLPSSFSNGSFIKKEKQNNKRISNI